MLTINPSSLTQVRSRAMEYLARREHSRLELRNKLARKGFEPDLIDSVLTQLQADNLLSDERFFDSFVRSQTNKGYGPLRIQQELKQRGIDRDLLTNLNANDTAWLQRTRQAREKRFGRELPQNPREQAKQMRFLQNIGFTGYQIQVALSSHQDE